MKENLIAGFVLLMGLFLAVTAFNDSRDRSKLDARGIDIISEPLDGYTERRKAGVVIGYSVSPRYKTQNGQTYTCSGNVDKEVVDRLQGFPVIKVRYLATKPQVCYVDGAETSGVWFLMLISIVMTLGSGAYIYNRSSL